MSDEQQQPTENILNLEVCLDPERGTVDIHLLDLPQKLLGDILSAIAEPTWRQNILDGVNGAIVAQDLGITYTERAFEVRLGES